MTVEMVEGPAWTGFGLQESAGRYPLRVETAVSRIVDRLLPGVITTTRHARMYTLHALVWAEAEERGLDQAAGAELLRRCEAVTAAIHHVHETHRVALSSAHGEDRLHLFLHDDRFDVIAAAAKGTGISKAGFSGVYQGPCVRIGALSPDQPPRRGPRADLVALREGLGELIDLAERQTLSVGELQAAGHLCLCEAATAADGAWLRRILIEEVEPGRDDDRDRQLTCALLLDTLHDAPTSDPAGAFRERWAFGDPLGDPASDERTMVASLWRAAALRNYSVGAWRWLWRWLAGELNAEPMTAQQLGQRLPEELEDVTVAQLLNELPPRTHEQRMLPVEAEVAAAEWSPTNAVRQLAIGAGRLEDLDEPTRKAFVGADTNDLGPRWVAGMLEEWRDRPLSKLGEELAMILVRRAKRVALSKMYLTRDGKPFVPTRLRDRDGLLSVSGQEGAGDVALRTDSLADLLAGLGVLTVDDGVYALSEAGEQLRARLT